MSDVCPRGAYDTDAQLSARQALWRFEVRPPDSRGRVLDAVVLTGDESVLDVGCGNGNDLADLTAAGHRGSLFGVDQSAGMLETVGTRLPHVARVRGDIGALPFGDHAVDVVLAMHMLYHVPDIALATREARRVLKRGGVFVASTNGENTLPELMSVWDAAWADLSGGVPLRRLSLTRFSLENGGEQLARSFAFVERIEQPGTVAVSDAATVRNYVDSTRGFYGGMPQPDAWTELLDRIEAHVQSEIDRTGRFEVTASRGLFVCR